MNYKDITPQDLINILSTIQLDKLLFNTLKRRLNNNKITITNVVILLYKLKDIDIRNEILKYRIEKGKIKPESLVNYKYHIKYRKLSK